MILGICRNNHSGHLKLMMNDFFFLWEGWISWIACFIIRSSILTLNSIYLMSLRDNSTSGRHLSYHILREGSKQFLTRGCQAFVCKCLKGRECSR